MCLIYSLISLSKEDMMQVLIQGSFSHVRHGLLFHLITVLWLFIIFRLFLIIVPLQFLLR